ncbi:MAG: hypothetical protein JNN15_20540, partial [Blastocatellia bacterium]|nr:hypothetical protein [Blastocatellia bacterium]
AIIAAATVYRLFSFSAEAISVRKTKKKKVEELEESINRFHLSLPVVLQQFDGRTELQQFLILTKTRFFGIIKEATFIAIVLIGSVVLVSNAIQAGSLYDTPTYPVTRAVMEIVADSFTLFFIIITTLYSGELVWKEKGINFDQIYDALPLPGYVTYLSRLLALMLVHISLIFGLIVVGVLTQIYYGYYKFELGLALRYQFGVTFPFLLQLSILTLLIQTLIRNKFLGHTVVILYYIAQIAIVQFGYEHKLYIFASRASLIYSDINGFGHFVKPMVAFSFYWTAFAGLLALVSLLYQVRGTDLDLKSRTKQAINNFTRPLQIVASTFALAFLSLGGYIFYNTNVLNQYVDSNQRRKLSAEFEKTYKKYEKLPQPKVTKVKLAVDIFPELRGMKAKGSYELKNKTSAEIDHIHIVQNRDMEEIFNFNREVKKELEDKKLNYTIYKLASPLKPGETCNLDFELSYSAKGFKNSDEDNSFAANGTFFNDSYFPTIGYNPNLELNDDDDRKKEGLNPKPTLPPVDDPEARMFSGLAHDADWITFDATVSTSPDQVAIAPGYLQKEWIENGRRYFEYSMEQTKILNFYSFLSGRFEVKRDKWKDVNIEVYYHKEHSYNLDRMINSVKKSLDYFTTNFGPYQHKQFRIIEFPRYDSIAQSFPN